MNTKTITLPADDYDRINNAIGGLSDGQHDLNTPDFDLAGTIERLVDRYIATEVTI